jgi:ligand-binding SRPBCC domain-containing protein
MLKSVIWRIELKKYVYKHVMIVSKSVENTFEFFSHPENLGKVTPSYLQFTFLTPLPVEMRKGTIIDYRLTIYKFRVHWRTEITLWEPPHRFIDKQIKGPYRLWVHEHTFESVNSGTRMTDLVEYAVPGGILAPLIHSFFVRKDIEKIFRFRELTFSKIFG